MDSRPDSFQKTMAAAAFAEANEHETARRIMAEETPAHRARLGFFDRLMLAITFAEANEHETARKLLRDEKRPEPRVRPRPSLRA